MYFPQFAGYPYTVESASFEGYFGVADEPALQLEKVPEI